VRYLKRVHQEDFCQALGRYPREKYEKDGGPGWRECFGLMETTANPATARQELLGRAVFQFLIGNPDAHAKNYSLVYRGSRLALSKLYDVNNAAAFRHHYKEQRPRLAMFVGGERDPNALELEHWDRFAEEVGIRRDIVRERLQDMARRLPPAILPLREETRGTGADSRLLDEVLADVNERCTRVASWFGK
jgi:serine/threonine-protein kinase HipA